MSLEAGGGGGVVWISPGNIPRKSIEPKVLPSFDFPPLLLAVFTQQLNILPTALNIMILILFLTRI